MQVRHTNYNDIFVEILYEKNQKYDFKKFTNKYIKLIIEKIDDPYAYDLFYKKLLDSNPINITILNMEQSIIENDLSIDENLDINTDTLKIIEDYINDSDLDKIKLIEYIRKCYKQANKEMINEQNYI